MQDLPVSFSTVLTARTNSGSIPAGKIRPQTKLRWKWHPLQGVSECLAVTVTRLAVTDSMLCLLLWGVVSDTPVNINLVGC